MDAVGLRILMIGDVRRREFAHVPSAFSACDRVVWLAPEDFQADDGVPNRVIVILQQHRAELPAGVFQDGDPDLIVWLQSRPGEFAGAFQHEIRTMFPLSPWVAVLGTLCEGEERSGTPMPGAARVWWHQWRLCAAEQLDRRRAGERCSWTLPPTAQSADYLAAEPCPRIRLVRPRHLRDDRLPVVVIARRRDGFEGLSAAVEMAGGRAVWLSPSSYGQWPTNPVPAVVFVDAEGDLNEDGRLVAQAAVHFPSVPRVLFLGYPRLEDIRTAGRLGASLVIGKPFPWYQLARGLLDLGVARRVDSP
ncbi:hypothetical protein JCM19992_33390 [Thermostilla marina]